MRLFHSALLLSALSVASLSITGCSTSFAPQTSSDIQASTMGTLRGRSFGGQQPLVGAHVYLMAASTGGYGSASTSLLDARVLINEMMSSGVDTLGYYVTTGSDGSFSISNDYTCTAGQQVYLLSTGGNPGSGQQNPAVNNIAVLGTCPSSQTFASTVPYIYMSEASTVAAAYALSGFATDATHIASASTTASQTALSNAFANAANLWSISQGYVPSAPVGGNGTVPQAKVYTLANILAACVNSNGPGSDAHGNDPCDILFANATSDGTSTGTKPADTATAAINMAHFPSANVATLYGIIPTTPAFAPSLPTAPNDLTLAIEFNGGGLSAPSALAVDASGNLWAANAGNNTVTELSATGTPVSTSAGFTDGAISAPKGIAIDTNGNAWVTNSTSHSLTEILANGTAAPNSPFVPQYASLSGSVHREDPTNGGALIAVPYGIAIDGNNNLFVSDATPSAGDIVELAPDGLTTLGIGGTGYLSQPQGIALTTDGNVWVTNYTQPTLDAITFTLGGGFSDDQHYDFSLNNATAVAVGPNSTKWVADFGSNEITSLDSSNTAVGHGGGGLTGPAAVAVDGAGSVWVPNSTVQGSGATQHYSISMFDNTGTSLTATTGLEADSADFTAPRAVAVDPSGNVWVATSGNAVFQFVGAATPVLMPLSAQIAAGTIAAKP